MGDHKDEIISDLKWKLNTCIETLKWYGDPYREPDEFREDDGVRAKDALEEIKDNKN